MEEYLRFNIIKVSMVDDLQTKYERGYYGLIIPRIIDLYYYSYADPMQIPFLQAGAEHLFAVELFPQYKPLITGFDTITQRSSQYCLLRDGEFTTNFRALEILRQIGNLGQKFLEIDGHKSLLQFMSVMKKRLEGNDERLLLIATLGASAFNEMLRCQDHRPSLVTPYYQVRPVLVQNGILPSIEELQAQGITPPLFRYREKGN